MRSSVAILVVLVELVSAGKGQTSRAADVPFTLTWSKGKCSTCKVAGGLGQIQFISRSDVWGVGYKGELNGVATLIVHSTDAGHTWREVPESRQHTDPDGQLAFWFLNARRGWVARRNPADGEPQMIGTRDGGGHWRTVSQQFLQNMQFTDESHGYGTVADGFFRSNDGGLSWVETKMPDIRFIDRMFFLTSDIGWLAGNGGITGTEFFVFRTVDGGGHWEESRTNLAQEPDRIHDLFFFDHQRGWLAVWNYADQGTYLYLTVDGGKHWTPDPNPQFQGTGKSVNVVRFTSREKGFVFMHEKGQSRLVYTTDGGAHWSKQALPNFVAHCQVFEGDVLCNSAGFRLLTLHPK